MAESFVSNAFGPVEFNQNSFVKVTGTENVGLLTSNANVLLSSFKSNLNLFGNVNVKANVENSTLNAKNNANLLLRGKDVSANLEGNRNAKFKGDGNEWEAISNTNLKVKGAQSKLKLGGNINLSINGNGNDVVAKNNSTLMINGDGNKLKISNTLNHRIKPARKEDALNQLEISPYGGGCGRWGWFRSKFSSYRGVQDPHPYFSITYVDQAEIDKEKYKLGIFDFTVKEKDSTLDVKMEDKGLDSGSITTTTSGPGEILVCARKKGEKQCLNLKALAVKETGDGRKFSVELKPIKI